MAAHDTGRTRPRCEVAALIVYFSSVSGYTDRFVKKLELPAVRIPLRPRVEGELQIDMPKVLILPTYGGGPETRAVPKQVLTFLSTPENRQNIVGVVGTGNTNFGAAYGLAAKLVARKLDVPLLNMVELFGTPEEIEETRDRIIRFMEGER